MFTKPWITEADIAAVSDALRAPKISRDVQTKTFEEAVAQYVGAKHAIAYNSGTAALHAAYYAAKVGPNDLIVTSPNTFMGTLTGALQLGAKPYLSDINPSTGNMVVEEPLRAPSRGRLIYVPVHFAGTPVDLSDLKISDPNAIVIEDASHAFGAKNILYGDMTAFSFHPAKAITTGEGGMVVTQSDTYAEALRAFRDQNVVGNFHMTEFQAALGLSQLKRIDEVLEKRKQLIAIYREHLTLLGDHPDSAHQLAVAQIDFDAHGISRDELQRQLAEKQIATRVHYEPLYRKLGLPRRPQMERYFAQALSLPLYHELEEDTARKTAETIAQILRKP